MREFFVNHVAESSLQRIPIEARLNRYREMHARARSLTLRKVLELTPDRARILVETAEATRLRMKSLEKPWYQPKSPSVRT